MTFNPQDLHLRRQGELNERTKHRIICFKKEESLIGRDEDADFQITDVANTQSISRKHFRILFRDGKMFIEAMEGKRVIVDGEKLDGIKELQVGSLIGFGRQAPKSEYPAVEFKVEGCIELEGSDDESSIRIELVSEPSANVRRLSVEDLVSGFEDLPDILQNEIQVISDDEEYQKAKNWQKKLQGKDEKRSKVPIVRIEKSSSQSSDIAPDVCELPQASSTPLTKSSKADEFYPTYSLNDLPPMRRLKVQISLLTEASVQRKMRQSSLKRSASENVAPKKRRTKKQPIKRSVMRPTAYDCVKAVVDSDSEDSDSCSLSTASSESRGRKLQPDSKKRRLEKEDANNNKVTQRQNSKPGTTKNASHPAKTVSGPKSVKRSLGIYGSADSLEAHESYRPSTPEQPQKTRKITVDVPQRGNEVIKEAATVPQSNRPTTSGASKKVRSTGALVSGHHGLCTAEDNFDKARQLRAESDLKHKEALRKEAQRPLSELEKKEHKPLINKGPRRRISRYVETTLKHVAPSAAARKPSTEEAAASDVEEKLQQSAVNRNGQGKPEAKKKIPLIKPKIKITKNNRTDFLIESIVSEVPKAIEESPSVAKLPPVSSLGRIPRKQNSTGEQRTSISDRQEAPAMQSANIGYSSASDKSNARELLESFKKKYVDKKPASNTSNSYKQHRLEKNASSNVPKSKPATNPESFGFYTPYTPPSDGNTSEESGSGGSRGITIEVLQNEPAAATSTKYLNPHNKSAVKNCKNKIGEITIEKMRSEPMGFYNSIEDSPEGDCDPSSQSTDASSGSDPNQPPPLVIFEADPNVSSILKHGPKQENAKKKSLKFASTLCTNFEYDDWDKPPLEAAMKQSEPKRAASPRYTYSPSTSSSFSGGRKEENDKKKPAVIDYDDWDLPPPGAALNQPMSLTPRFNQSPNASTSFSDATPRVETAFPTSSASREQSRSEKSPSLASSLSPLAETFPSLAPTLRDPRITIQGNKTTEKVSKEIMIEILRWSPDVMILQSNALKASYDSLYDFQWTLEGRIKPKLFSKLRDSLDRAAKEEGSWNMLFYKRAFFKNGLTHLVLSCNEQLQNFNIGDFLQIKLHNKTTGCEEKFFGHIRWTEREVPYGQKELFIETILDMAKLKDISVLMLSNICSISRDIVTLVSLRTLTETEIVKKMLRPISITSPAVITQKIVPSHHGFSLSPDQSLVVSSFDRGFWTDQGICTIAASPGAGKTTTLVESVLKALEYAKKIRTELPFVAVCAKTDKGVQDLAMLMIKTMKDTGFKIVINNDDNSEDLKPITLPVLVDQNRGMKQNDILRNADVVITKIELAHELFMIKKKFDLCFVDEAQQCSELDVIIPINFTTKKLVLFGDAIDPLKPHDPKQSGSLFERICNTFKGKYATPVMTLNNRLPGVQQF